MSAAYRPAFDCLWCGTAWTTRGSNDLEGWAQLCPTCLGRAGANPFLRGRLRRALASRVAAEQAVTAADVATRHAATANPAGTGRAGPPAPPPAFPDDWFLRRGDFERGAIHDAAWAAELDVVTRRLDALVPAGRILEPTAGVGFFSPLLAERGELFAFDADGDALARARDRLLAHGLRAHLHVADPWGAFPPDADPTPADAVVAAFLLGRVRGAGLDGAASSLRGRLRDGGRLAVVDLRPDPAGGPPPGLAWSFHDSSVLESALLRAGFAEVRVESTGRFFLVAEGLAA